MADGSLIFDTAVDTKGFNTGTKQISTSASKLKGTFKGLGGAALGASKAIGVGIAGATAVGATAIVGFGAKGIQLASDLSEVQNVVDTTFGDGAKKINEWAKNAGDSFGLSELQAKQMTGTLGAMLKSMKLAPKDVQGMSTAVTGLAGDFASFYNISSDDAFEKIRSGISGETEPLKQLGINMSVANLQAYALSTGIKKQYKNMTQAEQAQLRYGYLMKVSKDAQGDFSKTSGGFANQQRILKMRFDSLSAEVGKNLLPIMTDLITAMSATFKDKSFTDGIKAIFTNISALAKQAMPILLSAFKTFLPMMMQFSSKLLPIIFGLIKQLMPQIMAIAQQIIPMLIGMFNQLAPLILSLITTLLPVIITLIQTLLPPIIQIVQMLLPVIISLINALLPIIMSLLDVLMPILDLFIAILKPILDIVMLALTPLIAIISKLIQLAIIPIIWYLNVMGKMWGDIFTTILDSIKARIDAIKQIFTGLIEFITGVFSRDWAKAWNGIKDIFGGIWALLVERVKLPINLIIDIINGVVTGVYARINGMINALNGIKIDAPDWVTKLTGMSSFGFNLSPVSTPQIPKLATGTVVPANYGNFQAILGDNRKAPEVVSPVPTMIDAVMQALEMWGGGNGDMVLRVEGNSNNPLTQLARALLPYLTVEKRRKGGKVVG